MPLAITWMGRRTSALRWTLAASVLAGATIVSACGSSNSPGGVSGGGGAGGGGSAASTGQLTLSGAIQASIDRTTPGDFCSVSTTDPTMKSLTASWNAQVNGEPYSFEITLSFYQGPGTYKDTPDHSPVDFTMGKVTSTVSAVAGGSETLTNQAIDYRSVKGGTVVVAADEKSGTLDVPMKAGEDINDSAPEVAHIEGSWSCAQK
jgi:hypothetical protein